jgi:DNA-binding transcriptional MerR regulator
MQRTFHISDAAVRLDISPGYLRMLEKTGRIPPARRDYNGRIYSEADIALMRALGVGSRPRRLRRIDDLVR